MDTDYAPTPTASPSRLLVLDEVSYARLLDVLKILDHTHAISGAVSLVEAPQSLAGVVVAGVRTVPHLLLSEDRAGPYRASHAGARPSLIHLPASKTSVLLPEIAQTNRAVHSAGGDQVDPHHDSSASPNVGFHPTLIYMSLVSRVGPPRNGVRHVSVVGQILGAIELLAARALSPDGDSNREATPSAPHEARREPILSQMVRRSSMNRGTQAKPRLRRASARRTLAIEAWAIGLRIPGSFRTSVGTSGRARQCPQIPIVPLRCDDRRLRPAGSSSRSRTQT